MNLLSAFKEYIDAEELFPHHAHLLLAVSGGADSVVLCELCRQAGYSFQMAHCNFKLRGEESDRDEKFVRDLAKNYEAEIAVEAFDTEAYATANKLSIQVAARVLRYNWFNTMLNNQGGGAGEPAAGSPPTIAGSMLRSPDFLLTAHHADDNIETVLMNFFKGSGIAGIRGILPRQGRLVRPLLFARKAALLEYASANALQYVEDSSNISDKYTRNFFRNQLLPGVRKVFPQAEENILDNAKRFREIEQVYGAAIEGIKRKLLERKGGEVHIPVLKLRKITPLDTVLYEITKEYGFTPQQVKDLAGLLDSTTGKYVQSPEYRVIKNRNWLIITPNRIVESETIVINECNGELHFKSGIIDCRQLPAAHCKLSQLPGIAQLDADKIVFPLLLRRWKTGDYFYPFGMQKKKKLRRFLSDLKLSVPEKENTWILEMNKKVIWIIGYRIDDRFRITEKTSRVLRMQFTPTGSI